MKEFNFFIDKKCTVWHRNPFTIEAETLEESIEKAKKSNDKKEKR